MNGVPREAAAAAIIDHYQRHAAAFDAARSKHLFEKNWLDRFLKLVPHKTPVLDLGCGSGQPIARYLVDNGCSVQGIDSAPAMISMCATRFPAHRWQVADMRDLQLGERFGGILAWNSFFHLSHDDQRRMFPVFRDHAMPGAVLMFTSGPTHGIAFGTFADEPLFHASLAPEEYRSLLSQNDFAVLDFVPDDPACNGHTVWLAQSR